MAGAWTDTPPICSDYGGNVIGAAVKVDGKVREKIDGNATAELLLN